MLDTLTEVHRKLNALNLSLSTAESCTAGLLASTIVSLPGASSFYRGGAIAYSNEVKSDLLKVPEETLKEHGAVSIECAREMALGACSAFKSALALSTTGIAGPTGGTPEKPVGTVCIGLASSKGAFAKKFVFLGDRSEIQHAAVKRALEIFNDYLTELITKDSSILV